MSLVKMQEIIPGLFLGPSNVAKDKEYLLEHKIGAILNCTLEKDVPNYFPDLFLYHRIPIQDEVDSPLVKYIVQSNRILWGWHEKKKLNVLIHCECGISRSASLVIAYLMKTLKMPLYIALRHVASKRQWIKPNQGFINILRNYSFHLPKLQVISTYRTYPENDEIIKLNLLPAYHDSSDFLFLTYETRTIIVFQQDNIVSAMYDVKKNNTTYQKINLDNFPRGILSITQKKDENFFLILYEISGSFIIGKAVLDQGRLVEFDQKPLFLDHPSDRKYWVDFRSISNGKMWIWKSGETIHGLFQNHSPISFQGKYYLGKFRKDFAPVYWVTENIMKRTWIHDYDSVLKMQNVDKIQDYDVVEMEIDKKYKILIHHVDCFGALISGETLAIYWIDFTTKTTNKIKNLSILDYIGIIDNNDRMRAWQKYAHQEISESLSWFPTGILEMIYLYIEPGVI